MLALVALVALVAVVALPDSGPTKEPAVIVPEVVMLLLAAQYARLYQVDPTFTEKGEAVVLPGVHPVLT